jgi:hypothetical protein
VRDRLGDPIEHQPDPHPGAEHHRDPGHRPELGAIVVPAEADRPEAGQGQESDDDQDPDGRQHEEPAEVVDDPAENISHDRRQLVGPQRPHQHERHRDDGGYEKDVGIDPRALRLHALLLSGSRPRPGVASHPLSISRHW